jgi:hypothetical protein
VEWGHAGRLTGTRGSGMKLLSLDLRPHNQRASVTSKGGASIVEQIGGAAKYGGDTNPTAYKPQIHVLHIGMSSMCGRIATQTAYPYITEGKIDTITALCDRNVSIVAAPEPLHTYMKV